MDHVLTLFGQKLLEIALPTLATALAGLGVAFLSKKLQSIGITVDAQQQQQLKDLAAHTVIALEEQARRTPALRGAQKDAIAVATIQQKLPNAKAEDIRMAVDAALPAARKLVPSTPGSFGRAPA